MNDLPLGDMSASNPAVLPTKGAGKAVEVDVPEAEKEEFEQWLRGVWREKDILIEKFLNTGSFVEDPRTEVHIPLKLRKKREVLNAYTFFAPAFIVWVMSKLV